MRDHASTAGVVYKDVEPARHPSDRGGGLDRTGILCRRAARPMAGAGQARNQPVGRLGVVAVSDDDARPSLRKEAGGRGAQGAAFRSRTRCQSDLKWVQGEDL